MFQVLALCFEAAIIRENVERETTPMHLLYSFLDLFSSLIVSVPVLCLTAKISVRKMNGRKKLLLCLLVIYLSEVYLIVGLPGILYLHWDPNINWLPFRDFGDARYLFQTGMNAVMFLPPGILLPLLWPRYRRFSRLAAAGALTSAMIELLQLFCFRATDVDDLIMNTLGAALGYLLVRRWVTRQSAPPVTGKDGAEFWTVNILIVLTTILLRPFAAELIYRLPFFS